MKPETKRDIRQFTIRTLRKLLDFADEHLHAAEVRLREEFRPAIVEEPPPDRIPFEQWERRPFRPKLSGPSPHRRGLSAAEFDAKMGAAHVCGKHSVGDRNSR